MSNILEVKDLHKFYSNGTHALQGVSFNVKKGDFFALLGSNGAGKTTLIDIITSISVKNKGTIRVEGIDIEDNLLLFKSKIGVVPQEFNFNPFEKVLQILVKQGGYYGVPAEIARERAEYLLKMLNIYDKRGSVVRLLSGGMKRRLMLARALIHKPSILLLDEPTVGVDVELKRKMLTFIKKLNEEGTTIILTTHNLDEVEQLCKNLVILDKGHVVLNTTVKDIIKKLDVEIFHLNTQKPVVDLPKMHGIEASLIDDSTIEVVLNRKYNLNQIFQILSDANIHIISMKNKANRIEEFFVKLLNK